MGEGEGWSPSLAYIRRGGGAFFNITLSFSLSLFLRPRADSLVWSLHLVGGFTIIRTPLRCRNRDPDQSSFRCSSGSEPGGTSVASYVCNPARHYTCGATSSSEVLQHDREVVGSESTHRGTFPSFGLQRYEHRRGTFPLSVFKGMNIDSFCYIHQHSIDLGFGTRR